MPEKITEDALYEKLLAKKPGLANFPRAEVMAKVYAKKPELRDAVIAAPAAGEDTAFDTPTGASGTVAGVGLGQWPETITARQAITTPGVLPAIAGLAAMPLTGGLSLLPAAGLTGLAMGGGEAARQLIAGGEKTPTEAAIKIGKEAGIGAGSVLVFGAGSAALSGLRSYVAQSPRILTALARTASALTGKKLSAETILEGIQRPGVSAKMPQIEAAVSSEKASNLAASGLKEAQLRGGQTLIRLQKRLKNQRLLMGKEIEKVDNQLVDMSMRAGKEKIDLSVAAGKMFDEFYLPTIGNPILKDLPGTIKLGNKLTEIAVNPVISVGDAIKTKRIISQIYEDFSNKGVMNVQDINTLNLAMKGIRKELDIAIKGKAKDLGFTGYKKTYQNFSKFADDYDSELLPIFGAKEGRMSVEARINNLAGQANAGDLRLEIIKDAKRFLPKDVHEKTTAKVMDDFTDYLVLNSIYKDFSGAPSSLTVGLARLAVEPAVKGLSKVRAPIPPYSPSIPARLTGPAISGITGE